MTETALVTGASSGIGRELAELFAADGSDLVVVARSEGRLHDLAERLNEEYGVHVTVAAKDLTDPEAPAALAEALRERDRTVDVLVNNAGFATAGAFVETDADRERDEILLNVVALTDLTKRFLPGMVRRGEGRVLNVASLAGFQPGPYMAVYYATKAYVLHFSEAVWYELRETPVSVTALCPGPVATNFAARAGVEETENFRGGGADPAVVARAGYEGMREGRRTVVPSTRSKLLARAGRTLPRSVVLDTVADLNTR
jgi:hypothetical protein